MSLLLKRSETASSRYSAMYMRNYLAALVVNYTPSQERYAVSIKQWLALLFQQLVVDAIFGTYVHG